MSIQSVQIMNHGGSRGSRGGRGQKGDQNGWQVPTLIHVQSDSTEALPHQDSSERRDTGDSDDEDAVPLARVTDVSICFLYFAVCWLWK